MKNSYSYYATNAFKWYFRQQPKPDSFRSEANRKNWETCEKVVGEFEPGIVETVKAVYSSADTIGDAVYAVAKEKNIHQDNIWTMLAMIEKRFARERGLI